MDAFCTYCSAAKSEAPGEIPAGERYLSRRIAHVRRAADLLGVRFCILSGEYGLILPSRPIPYYDHLLQPAEVAGLAGIAAHQLAEHGLSRLVYFTAPLAGSPTLIPYRDLIASACERASVPLFVVELADLELWD